MIKVSDYIIKFFEEKGINIFFSMSGGMITHLEDSVYINKNVKLVSMKHEQAGAFAAEGYARTTGKTGVAMGTSGPGATNMITGIASAFFDSIPVIYLCGQVNVHEITKSSVRQTGFQETDIISLTNKITKFSYQIIDPLKIKYILEKSYYIANNGRKGPIVLDIPMNIQKIEVDENSLISFFNSNEYNQIISDKSDIIKVNDIFNLLQKTNKPIIIVGGGARNINEKYLIEEFSKNFNIPIVSSLMGLDVINHNFENYLGMIGTYGNREANISLTNSDLILVLGSRLDIRQTGANKDIFSKNKIIIHVDIDKNELGYNIKNTQLKIHGDLELFLKGLKEFISNNNISLNFSKWNNITKNIKKIIQKNEIIKDKDGFYLPGSIFKELSRNIKKNKIIINDVGQNQMISSTSFFINKGDQIINSGGLGSMGFSLPAAIGSFYGNEEKLIISINGDGGFQMNIQELETISKNNIPILIIILNNYSLGMVREFQDSYFDGRNIGTVIGYSCPNFRKISMAYGLNYFKIGKNNLKNILKKISIINRPTIVEIEQNKKSSITKLMFGDSLDKQSPYLDEKLLKKIEKLLNNL